jgi:hypothetical protein
MEDRHTDAVHYPPRLQIEVSFMSRPDPNATLARYHVRHVVPQVGCPLCMRAKHRSDDLPRWSQPRAARAGAVR